MTWVADRESLDCRMLLRLQVPVTDRAEDATGNQSRIGMLGPRRHASGGTRIKSGTFWIRLTQPMRR
jgi:hypothetical protein